MRKMNDVAALFLVLTYLLLPVLTIWTIFSHGMLNYALSDLVLLVFFGILFNATKEGE